MSNPNRSQLIDDISTALSSFNETIRPDGVGVRAFSLEQDDELGLVAKVIYVIDDIARAEDMNFIDRYCGQSGEILKDYVEFVFCRFRSEAEYHSDSSDSPWGLSLIELQHAA
ncbi:MAG: hypothetical protein KDI44_18360 [Thiothrix sp.]|nr:hypothetical protein [Thiothrix sp.]HPQ97369.1 hypothetical protein [Thiolinea sp.]